MRTAVGFLELLLDERCYCPVLALAMATICFSAMPGLWGCPAGLTSYLSSPSVLLLYPHHFSNPCLFLPHNLKELGTQPAYPIGVTKYLIINYFIRVILTVYWGNCSNQPSVSTEDTPKDMSIPESSFRISLSCGHLHPVWKHFRNCNVFINANEITLW